MMHSDSERKKIKLFKLYLDLKMSLDRPNCQIKSLSTTCVKIQMWEKVNLWNQRIRLTLC